MTDPAPTRETPSVETPPVETPSVAPSTGAADAALAVFGLDPVFLHAHPDDESISTGGTIAALMRAGARVGIVTGTRGERGEVMAGELAALEGSPELGPHRVGELAAALTELGSPRQVFLGAPQARAIGASPRVYADSGMRWGDDGFAQAALDAPVDALSRAPLADVVADLAAGVSGLSPRPTALIGYDAQGGYGHPDHVRMHDAGVETARILGVPYFAIVEPRVEAADPSAPRAGRADDSALVEVPLGPFVHDKARAMAAHATQLGIEGGDFVLTGGQRHPIADVETFRRVV